MLYILDQRLRAQSIPDEKARKGKLKLKRVCKRSTSMKYGAGRRSYMYLVNFLK